MEEGILRSIRTDTHLVNIIRIVCASFTLVCASLVGIAATPATAAAEDISTLVARAEELRAQIEQAETDYTAAVAEEARLDAELGEAQSKLDETQAQLDDAQERLSRVVRDGYAGVQPVELIGAALNASTMEETLRDIEYMRHVNADIADITLEVVELRDEQAETVEQIKQLANDAEQAAEDAQERKTDLQTQLDEIQPEIEAMTDAMSEVLNNLTGWEQYEANIAFLKNANMISQYRANVISGAYQQNGWSGGWCEAWANAVFTNYDSGIDYRSHATAYIGYQDYCDNTDLMQAHPGDLIYTTGGYSAGHVGIIVSAIMGENGEDTLIMDERRAIAGHTPMRYGDWIKQYTYTDPYTGITGFLGTGDPWDEYH